MWPKEVFMGLKQSPLFALVASSTKHSSTMHFIHGPHKVHSLGLHRNRDKNKSYWFNRCFFFDQKQQIWFLLSLSLGPKPIYITNLTLTTTKNFLCGLCGVFQLCPQTWGTFILFSFILSSNTTNVSQSRNTWYQHLQPTIASSCVANIRTTLLLVTK